MDLSMLPYHFVLGAAGAASLELLNAYELRGKLELKKYRSVIRSPLFWCVVVGMLLASGFIAWALHAGSEHTQVWHVVVTGMAARSVARNTMAAKAANASQHLGEGVSLRDVLA